MSTKSLCHNKMQRSIPVCLWEARLESSTIPSLTFELFYFITGPECGGNLYSAGESNAATRGNCTAECGECKEKNI